jgi:hypothetical protein
MTQGKYVELSVAQRTDVWRRWKAGESLHTIGRAFDRPHTSVHCLLAHHGGIVPALRWRGLLTLTVTEREEISRGMASWLQVGDVYEMNAKMASVEKRE